MKKFIKLSIVSLVVIVVSAVMVVFSGVFNVSAGWEDPPLLRWLLASTREASIEVRAKDIDAPKLDRVTQVRNGFRSYREMCAICHTPPGKSNSPITLGLNPPPPDLSFVNEHAMSDSEIFWVIKNGIRMTGMPAWGPTHDDNEIWDIVAFVKALPSIDADAYRELDKKTLSGHEHSSSTELNSGSVHIQRNDHGGHTDK